jgi:hypothetical protein
LKAQKAKNILHALFESGANLSCNNEQFAVQIGNLEPFLHPRKLATVAEYHFIEITSALCTDFYLNDVHLSDEFLLVPQLSEEAITGAATMLKWRLKFDIENDTVFVDPKVAKLQLV